MTIRFPAVEFAAVMGPSGSGKSTLLHCLAALDVPSSGKVFLGETDVSTLSSRERAWLRRDRVGFVFQAFNLVPTLDARENIVLPQRLAGREPEPEWLEVVVDQVGLRDRLHHRPAELSGGQQQRVAVARALAGRPEIIFADEPTGNLDTRSGHEVLGLLRAAVDDHGQTVVMVTHDPMAAAYADRVVFLGDGRVVDELRDPSAEGVLERLKSMGGFLPGLPTRRQPAAPTLARRSRPAERPTKPPWQHRPPAPTPTPAPAPAPKPAAPEPAAANGHPERAPTNGSSVWRPEPQRNGEPLSPAEAASELLERILARTRQQRDTGDDGFLPPERGGGDT